MSFATRNSEKQELSDLIIHTVIWKKKSCQNYIFKPQLDLKKPV